MKLLKHILLLTGFFTLTAHSSNEVATEGAEVGQWTMDYDAAVKLAAGKELPMMLNFTGSDWCGWCKIMDRNVFAEDEWKKFAAENVVLVTLDFPRDKTIVPEKYVDRNKTLQLQFGVRGYPTYIVLASDGTTRLGKLGAGREKTPASFIKEFQSLLGMSPPKVEEFKPGSPEQAEAYKKAAQEVKDAEQALAEWIATKPARNEETMKKHTELRERIRNAKATLEQIR